MPLDIGVGILLALLASRVFFLDLTWLFILVVIIFALLPDFDGFIEWLRHGTIGGKEIREHREITHFPITYILVDIIAWLVWGNAWAFLFTTATSAHLIHDGVGIGWGIKYLWPLSKKSYKFFSEKNGAFSSRLVVSWEPEELREVVREHGDPNWFWNTYFRLHPVGLIEYAFLALSLVILYVHTS